MFVLAFLVYNSIFLVIHCQPTVDVKKTEECKTLDLQRLHDGENQRHQINQILDEHKNTKLQLDQVINSTTHCNKVEENQKRMQEQIGQILAEQRNTKIQLDKVINSILTHYKDKQTQTIYRFTEKQQTTDYLQFGTLPSMNAVTVCIWVKTSHSDRYMGVLSYNIPGTDNEITIFLDPNGKIRSFVHAAGYRVISNYHDDRWHHICYSWESKTGKLITYMDGTMIGTKTGHQTGYTIQSGGILILGQDQDSHGGGFVASQSFQGSLTGLNIWDKCLNADEIKACPTNNSIFLWDEGPKPSVHGDVHGYIIPRKGTDFC